MKKNFKKYLIKKLESYSKEDIIITPHAEIRMIQRQIDKNEVMIIL
jgi:hypothetical protein